MAYVSVSRRRTLKRKHQLGCPTFLGYPLDTAARTRDAASRYAQRRTRKCKGGLARIRRAEKKFGIEHRGREAFEFRGMRVTLTIR